MLTFLLHYFIILPCFYYIEKELGQRVRAQKNWRYRAKMELPGIFVLIGDFLMRKSNIIFHSYFLFFFSVTPAAYIFITLFYYVTMLLLYWGGIRSMYKGSKNWRYRAKIATNFMRYGDVCRFAAAFFTVGYKIT